MTKVSLCSAYDTEIKCGMTGDGVIVSLDKKTLNATLSMCRKALGYIVCVLNDHYDDWSALTGTDRFNKAEHLIHSTRHNQAVCDFDKHFYKFPSGIRRSAVAEAIGIVCSYRSNHKNWEADPRGQEPKLSYDHYWMPTVYRKNPSYAGGEIEQTGRCCYNLKVYKNNDWVWMPIVVSTTDTSYIERHCMRHKAMSPALKKKHGKFFLTWVFSETTELTDKEPLDRRICAVDMGIISDAVCTIMDSHGTVYASKFINSPYEKDQVLHLCNRIKKNQRIGKAAGPLWEYASNFNNELAIKTANAIVSFAVEHDADCIVFEHLDTQGKKRGSRKQRLHMWKHRNVQKMAEFKAHQLGIRISRICAWGTSKLAYDGSGEIKRGRDVSEKTPYDVCVFTTGKTYNCDLSASKNIGARYFLREIAKLFPDYTLPSAPQRTMFDLWKADRELFASA